MEISNGDLTLHVAVDGDEAAPPVVLLHGITSSVRTWDWLVPDLVDRYRVIRLDFRGHGGSGRAPGGYDYAGYVSDAAAVCEQVAGGPCVVVGHSLGGGTAAALAQQRADLVRAVVLEDPPLGPARDLEGNTLMDGFRLMRGSIPHLQESGATVADVAGALSRAPSAIGTTFGELLHADALEAMAAGMLDLDATVLDPVLEQSVEPAYDATAGLAVPALVITADPTSPDCVARTADMQALVSVSPQVEVVVMPGCSHLVHDELAHRDVFRDAVVSFLERLGV